MGKIRVYTNKYGQTNHHGDKTSTWQSKNNSIGAKNSAKQLTE